MWRRGLWMIWVLAIPPLALSATATPENSKVPAEFLVEFQTIEALAAKSAHREAADKVQEILPRLQERPGARALLLRYLASLYGQMGHYAHAAATLEDALALRALTPNDSRQAAFELGQFHAAADNYPKADQSFSAWIQSADATPDQLLLLAEVKTRLKEYTEAAKLVQQAIEKSPQPKLEWFQSLLGLYHAGHDLEGCSRVLCRLIGHNPGDHLLWQQLTGVYQEAGKDQEALAVRQLMYERGMLSNAKDIVQLVQVLRFRGLSNRAAELMQREVDGGGLPADSAHFELLADCWIENKDLDKAASALEKAAAIDDSAETHHRLGQLYSEMHDWSKARQALSRAVAKPGLKNPGGANLLLGLANYRLREITAAKAAFTKALSAPAVKKTAQQWLDHIERETSRRAAAVQ